MPNRTWPGHGKIVRLTKADVTAWVHDVRFREKAEAKQGS